MIMNMAPAIIGGGFALIGLILGISIGGAFGGILLISGIGALAVGVLAVGMGAPANQGRGRDW